MESFTLESCSARSPPLEEMTLQCKCLKSALEALPHAWLALTSFPGTGTADLGRTHHVCQGLGWVGTLLLVQWGRVTELICSPDKVSL